MLIILTNKSSLVRVSEKNIFHSILLAKTDGDDGNDMEKKLFLVLISKETEVCNQTCTYSSVLYCPNNLWAGMHVSKCTTIFEFLAD